MTERELCDRIDQLAIAETVAALAEVQAVEMVEVEPVEEECDEV